MACVVVVRRHKRSLQILDFRDFCQRMSLRKDNVLAFQSEKKSLQVQPSGLRLTKYTILNTITFYGFFAGNPVWRITLDD